MKRVIGRTDMEDALKRLDKLTQEEARMAVAENLKATHAVDDRVRRVANAVDAMDNRVAGVDDRVAGVDNRVASVDDRVARVDDRVARVDDRLKVVDDKVAEVIHGAQIIFRQSAKIVVKLLTAQTERKRT
jgi:archaellum component FlaC